MKSTRLTVFWIALCAVAACDSPGRSEPGARSGSNTAAVSKRRAFASNNLVVEADGASRTAVDALNVAAALDIPKELIASARLVSSDARATIIADNYGVIKPRKGTSLAVLSTGLVMNDGALPEPGTDFAPSGFDGDAVTLELKLNVPKGSHRISFDYHFLSAESPEYVGSDYNDAFSVNLTDANGRRQVAYASVDSSFFYDVSETRAGGTGFEFLMADDPQGLDSFPPNYLPQIQIFADAGMTGLQKANFKVESTGVVTLVFDIRDSGDGLLDSTVVLDNFTLSVIEAVNPNPELIDVTTGHTFSDVRRLVGKGKPVSEVAADGVSEILLRVEVPGPGLVEFSLPEIGGTQSGTLVDVGRTSPADTRVNVPATPVGAQYFAFAVYTSPEDFCNSPEGECAQKSRRDVNIVARYFDAEPPTVMAFEGVLALSVIRPPVVIVPDVWAGCVSWKNVFPLFVDEHNRFAVSCADYREDNSESLHSPLNQSVVRDAIRDALLDMRLAGAAVSQVDVIAHGAGGLLVRKFVDSEEYRARDNFKTGYVNRFISVNTPHLGMRLASAIVDMRNAVQDADRRGVEDLVDWEDIRDGLVISRIGIEEGSAVDDLALGSAYVRSIGQTSIPSHLMVSTKGKVGSLSFDNALQWGYVPDRLKPLYASMSVYHPYAKSELGVKDSDFVFGLKSKVFCDDDFDMFVSESEQKGGNTADKFSNFIETFNLATPRNSLTAHHLAPFERAHTSRFVELLNSQAGGNQFTPFLESPARVSVDYGCFKTKGAPVLSSANGSQRGGLPVLGHEGLRSSADVGSGISAFQSLLRRGLAISTPSVRAPVAPGERVTISVTPTGGFNPSLVYIVAAGQTLYLEQAPFVFEWVVPSSVVGAADLVAVGIGDGGELLRSERISLSVDLKTPLVAVEVLNKDVLLLPKAERRLRVLGVYADGVRRDISSPIHGTVYSSSNTEVVAVTGDGIVRGERPGVATIAIRNGAVFTSISVYVEAHDVPEGGGDGDGECIQIRLGDYNLFVLKDFLQGHYVQGRVAAGGNIVLDDFSVGRSLPDTDISNVLVGGGDISLSRGGVWGDVRYGGRFSANDSVNFLRGTVSSGRPVDFEARETLLKTLSSRLSALSVNGTVELSWGAILLKGTSSEVNVFNLEGTLLPGSTLIRIEAPAGSLAVINVRGTAVSFSNLGQDLVGGIDAKGVLFNFPEATSLTTSSYSFQGTVLAPTADVSFTDGVWEGGLYARSLTGDNASGHLNPLRERDICR
ncbi:choice-of-anchor A family protein [Archangium primigenium]|uniref:choice-of-anchor A family protein n=1 Tax=[Archangium] primigenium TaxID=2792470 RepID=UPI00195A3321|nr:choice-of-anchor A family protein [Archangium primigenium]MBM7112069.1 choice-of-anchor A family protein [Archangium primigenium]